MVITLEEIKKDRKELLRLREKECDLQWKLYPYPHGTRELKEKAERDRETKYKEEVRELNRTRIEISTINVKYRKLFKDILYCEGRRDDGENDLADLLLAIICFKEQE